MILVSKFMVHRALSNKTYLSLGLLSPLRDYVKLSKHIYFCEIVYFKTLLKTKKNVDLAKVIGFKPH